MKALLASLLMFLSAAFLAPVAQAQIGLNTYLEADTKWYPAPGLYWNPSEHGQYYHVSIGPDGYVFVALTLFDSSGAPTFLVMQGPLAIDVQNDFPQTLGVLRSPLYRMDNGQCLGCPHRNPDVADSGLGTAELAFKLDGRAEFRLAGRTTPLQRYQLITSAAQLPRNRLVGDWMVHVSGGSFNNTPAGIATVNVRIAPYVGEPLDQTGNSLTFRPDELLTLDCLDCAPWAQRLLETATGFAIIGARDDERLRLFAGYPSQSGNPARILDNGVLHERDGVFYGRGGAGQFIFSFVMARKLTPRVRPQP